MVHVKILLDTRRQKADGSYSIIYRITNVKKVYTISTGVSVQIQFWDDTNREVARAHPNAKTINAALSKKYYEIQKGILKLQDEGQFSYEELQDLLSDKPKKVLDQSFKAFADKVIQDFVQVSRIGNSIVYQTAVNRLLHFCGNPKIKFTEITFTLLDNFSQEMYAQGIKINSVGNYLRSIRALYNKAIKAKIVNREHYPFNDISIKVQKTAKRAISKEIISQIKNLPLPENTPIWHARNYFMLSFYFIGISFTDLAYLKATNIYNGRIEFKRRKTHKQYTIKLFECTYSILSLYTKGQYLLPVIPTHVTEDTLESKKIIYQWIKTTNKYLKVIGKSIGLKEPLTTYVARHTWATTARRLGYSKELIAAALGHEEGNRITDIYLDNFDSEIIDKMHEQVID